MVGILSQLPYVGEKIAASSAGAGASTFMIAYFVHKMMAPIRLESNRSSVGVRTRGVNFYRFTLLKPPQFFLHISNS